MSTLIYLCTVCGLCQRRFMTVQLLNVKLLVHHVTFKFEKVKVISLCTASLNVQKFYILPTEYLYVLCASQGEKMKFSLYSICWLNMNLTKAIPLCNNNCTINYTPSVHNHQYSNIMYAIGYTVATCFDRKRSSDQ